MRRYESDKNVPKLIKYRNFDNSLTNETEILKITKYKILYLLSRYLYQLLTIQELVDS